MSYKALSRIDFGNYIGPIYSKKQGKNESKKYYITVITKSYATMLYD